MSFSDAGYEIWRERSIIADCLREIGKDQMASFVIGEHSDHDFVQYCLRVVKKEADRTKNQDIIDRLCFSGLIYA